MKVCVYVYKYIALWRSQSRYLKNCTDNASFYYRLLLHLEGFFRPNIPEFPITVT